MQPKCSDDMLAALLVDGSHTNQILPYCQEMIHIDIIIYSVGNWVS